MRLLIIIIILITRVISISIRSPISIPTTSLAYIKKGRQVRIQYAISSSIIFISFVEFDKILTWAGRLCLLIWKVMIVEILIIWIPTWRYLLFWVGAVF